MTCSSFSALLRNDCKLSSCEPPILKGCDPESCVGDSCEGLPLDRTSSSSVSRSIDVSKLSFSPPSTTRQELSMGIFCFRGMVLAKRELSYEGEWIGCSFRILRAKYDVVK
jgi:hypothetical protein